jgi:tRNA nucleotidyltransferase (CCA-adding enzyme)
MRPSELRLPESSLVRDLAQKVTDAGGRIVLVGGWVRDRLMGEASNDYDLEVFGLTPDTISDLVRPFGFTRPVGRHFPVWRETRRSIDLAYPRAGAMLYSETDERSLARAFREAARHRDLTINAMGWDPGSGAFLDPFGGAGDLEALRLRAVDASTFGADPLRVLRVARLRAKWQADADAQLLALCRGVRLEGLPTERISAELRRTLCETGRPSLAFDFLDSVDQLEIFAPIAALRGVLQDPKWHPEGDVYVHTGMVVDRAAELAEHLTGEEREVLMFAALCHDLGKPVTTTIEGDRIRSLGHEAQSAQVALDWLQTLSLPVRRIRQISTLVAHHLSPAQFVGQGAGPAAYRRLARKLAAGDVTVIDLERLARADHLGRSTPDARAHRFEAGDAFLDAAAAAQVRDGVRVDVVPASALIERGVDPGPRLGLLLARCREIQDETGFVDVGSIVERVLEEERN